MKRILVLCLALAACNSGPVDPIVANEQPDVAAEVRQAAITDATPEKPLTMSELFKQDERLTRDCIMGNEQAACDAEEHTATQIESRGYCQPEANSGWQKCRKGSE